ncbi:MAG: helix-turn-helix transcriptional regulator [Candidatus Sericytochromatia bacterium]
MKKVERLIALMYLIKRRKGLRTREIAHELGTTERTVYRDIASLNEAFRDYVQIIYTEAGYYLDRTIYAPPLRLIGKELEALNAVVLALENNHPHAQLARQALSKMKSAYAETENLDLLELEAHLQVLSPIPKDRVEPEILLELEKAIQKREEIQIDYFSFSSQTQRELRVHPHALVLRKHAWYLMAWSETHGKIIQLRAYRIRACQNTNTPFTPQLGFSVKDYFANHWSAFQGKPEAIVLAFDARTAQLVSELEWHPSQKLDSLPEGGLKMHLRAPVNPELISWILGWEGGCRVLEPQQLREQVIQAIKALAQNHGLEITP